LSIPGALSVTGAVTGGTYNGQTISSAASLTGTLAVAGAVTGGTYNGQTISSAASLTGTLAVAGAVTGGTYNGQTISSAASLTGTLTTAGALTVNGANSAMAGPVTVNAPSSAVTALTVNGNSSATWTILANSSGGNSVIAQRSSASTYSSMLDMGAGGSGTGVIQVNATSAMNLVPGTHPLVQAVDDGGTMQTVGWRGTPYNLQNSAYTLAFSDRGKCVGCTGSNTPTYTVPASVFSAGDVVTIANFGGGAITIAQGTSLTMYWANGTVTTGNRTLAVVGIATILFISATTAIISGSALS
jgi:hypothetical protein